MILLDGKALAKKIREELERVSTQLIKRPGLAVIICGDDPASHIYVRNKQRVARKMGFLSEEYILPKNVTEEELRHLIRDLNTRSDIHGILLQLPLPKHLKAVQHLKEISPTKDVDGFHPLNVGHLVLGMKTMSPCTPLGVIRLLRHYEIPIKGQNVTIIGKSNVVGRPLAELFFLEQATVSICHTDTRDLKEHTRDADILVTAAGCPKLINSTHLGRDCVLVDVGINRLEDGRICGDMDFDDLSASPLCKAITPVPGGIGPMTIAMLMQNTLKAYQNLENMEGILGKWETFPAKGEGSYR